MGNGNAEQGLPEFEPKKTVASADEVETPLQASRVTTEGARQDLQERVFPDLFPIGEKEYAQPGPVADLPEKVSQGELLEQNKQHWYNCGPADNESQTAPLSGTKVTENRVYHPEREARQR